MQGFPNGWRKQNYRTTARNRRLAATALTQRRQAMPRKLSELRCCRAGGFMRLGLKDKTFPLVSWMDLYFSKIHFKAMKGTRMKLWLFNACNGPRSIYKIGVATQSLTLHLRGALCAQMIWKRQRWPALPCTDPPHHGKRRLLSCSVIEIKVHLCSPPGIFLCTTEKSSWFKNSQPVVNQSSGLTQLFSPSQP